MLLDKRAALVDASEHCSQLIRARAAVRWWAPVLLEGEHFMSELQPTIRNRILGSLPKADFALVEPHLQRTELRMRQVVAQPGDPLEHLIFPESGLLSLLAQSPDDRIEVGMIGREGVTGAGGAFGAAQHVHTTMCQGDGQAHQIDVRVLRDLVQQSTSIATVMGRYLHCLTIQIGQTAYANASMNIEARLARWVLMTDDRTDGYELSLTHEFMAAMLGTRRPGVTTAIHVLEGARMIRAERGVIVVTDRGKLEDLASDAYGLAEAEYERLFAQV